MQLPCGSYVVWGYHESTEPRRAEESRGHRVQSRGIAHPMRDERFVFNGVDGATGDYLWPKMTPQQIVGLARGTRQDGVQSEAAKYHEAFKDYEPLDANPKNLAESGWGLLMAHDEQPGVYEALEPLLRHRRAQAGERYRECRGAGGVRPKERKPAFLARHGAPTSGPAEPERMPYYLLVVGSAEAIPCEFQMHLGIQYAVGRLHFDTLEEYDHYARSVVAYERGEVSTARRVGLFGVRNPDDLATTMSADELMAGLEAYLRAKAPDWALDVRMAEQATRAELAKVLGGPDTPAVLLTASHGVGFPRGDDRQRALQGALLCQDWPGPRSGSQSGGLSREMYFAGEDLTDSARLVGLIAFFFACYGGGTSKFDTFGGTTPKQIADHAFFGRLPQRVLGHPRGGALATVAHIDRAWSHSFAAVGGQPQIATFKNFLKRLLGGHPVGSALESFGARHGELSSDLFEVMEQLEQGDPDTSEADVAQVWTESVDARNYLILGDPAVRVPPTEEREDARSSIPEHRSHMTFGVGSEASSGGSPPAAETRKGSHAMAAFEGLSAEIGKISEALQTFSSLGSGTGAARPSAETSVQGTNTYIGSKDGTGAGTRRPEGDLEQMAAEILTQLTEQAQKAREELVTLIEQRAPVHTDRDQ